MGSFIRGMLTASFIAAAGWSGALSAGTIQQTIQFPGVEPQAVYDAYMTAKSHAAMTGFPAAFYRPSTQAEVPVGAEGDEFRGFGVTSKDGKLFYLIGGRILRLVPGKEIVMTWHAAQWDEHAPPGETGPDCILVLTLKKSYGGGTELQLVQVDIPEFPGLDASAAAGQYVSETSTVNTNWWFRYWTPMLKYFAAQAPATPAH